MNNETELYTTAEAAAACGRATSTINGWIAKGWLSYQDWDGVYYVTPDALQRCVEERERRAQAGWRQPEVRRKKRKVSEPLDLATVGTYLYIHRDGTKEMRARGER